MDIMIPWLYTNNKTGRKYETRSMAINTTNNSNGEIMVLYVDCTDTRKQFVRECTEFKQKFTLAE